jgi:N-acetyl-gamma-glutamyl-phosphate reductase
MSETKQINAVILGASGYTGVDLVRLLVNHPNVVIKAMSADRKAGQPYGETYPHLAHYDLPDLVAAEEIDYGGIDVVFCCLPHGTTQKVIAALPEHVRVIDLSADFRLENVATYAEWYGHEHYAPELQPGAVYGLTEHYRDKVREARLVACPGCYPTAALMMLLPLMGRPHIVVEDVIIDAKSGATGAGRSLKENLLFSEVAEAMHAYGVASHRHSPEIEQELSKKAGKDLFVNFTPHLVPMNRGEYLTIYARLAEGVTADDIRAHLDTTYRDEPFVNLAAPGLVPATRHVRGSNYVLLNVFADRVPGRVILFSTLDNLVKGSSGQALQNMNVMFGLSETTGLTQAPLFP